MDNNELRDETSRLEGSLSLADRTPLVTNTSALGSTGSIPRTTTPGSTGAIMDASTSTTHPSAPLADVVPAVEENRESAAPAPRQRYVRQRAPRRTQEAIDDLAEDDNPVRYEHESNVTVGGSLADRKYRSARSGMSKFQKNNRYGQYLQIPKGRRSIFAKRERSRRRQSTIAAIVVIGILAAAAYIVFRLVSTISFG